MINNAEPRRIRITDQYARNACGGEAWALVEPSGVAFVSYQNGESTYCLLSSQYEVIEGLSSIEVPAQQSPVASIQSVFGPSVAEIVVRFK